MPDLQAASRPQDDSEVMYPFMHAQPSGRAFSDLSYTVACRDERMERVVHLFAQMEACSGARILFLVVVLLRE